jgi:isorenieratene synthase
MLSFDPVRTYARYDQRSVRDYLDSLAFPSSARQMLFDVFSHSFFNPESEMSAAELLMMFHFYFMANREGLIFDVIGQPTSRALFQPLAAYLTARGVQLRTSTAAHSVRRDAGAGFVVEHAGGTSACDALVLALDVGALQALFARSPQLHEPALRRSIEQLQTTRPFAVWRLWLDRTLQPERAPFAGTTGVGLLDNISIYDRFQDESAAWTRTHGGSVVELHAYALPEAVSEAQIRADLLAGLHTLYPESRSARSVDEHFSIRADCPAFAPSSHAQRPTPATALPDLALAGDFTRMPFPCALMERAAASGFLAANHLLAQHGVAAEPLRTVSARGLFARPASAEPLV